MEIAVDIHMIGLILGLGLGLGLIAGILKDILNQIKSQTENDFIDPKVTFGISENIINNYLDTFYSINLQHFVDDKTNEILAKEYIEYKGKFIKSFMEIHGESEVLGKYITLCFSNTESFITKLSDDFDIYLKVKIQDIDPTE